MSRKVKISLDIVMTLLMIFLMGYSLTGQMLHEWCGTVCLIIFIIHNIINRKWYKTLFKGKYNFSRLIRTAINLMTLIAACCLGISGIMMSSYVFSFLPIHSGMSVARSIHLSASYWMYIFISLHIGMHWNMPAAKLNNLNRKVMICLRCLAVIVALYGLYLFINYGFIDYMFLRTIFAAGYEGSAVRFTIEYIVIMELFVFIGYYISKMAKTIGR